jgi:hypothetical protein
LWTHCTLDRQSRPLNCFHSPRERPIPVQCLKYGVKGGPGSFQKNDGTYSSGYSKCVGLH